MSKKYCIRYIISYDFEGAKSKFLMSFELDPFLIVEIRLQKGGKIETR